jgi:hypothetical protein
MEYIREILLSLAKYSSIWTTFTLIPTPKIFFFSYVIPEGVTEASQIFLLDTHLPK